MENLPRELQILCQLKHIITNQCLMPLRGLYVISQPVYTHQLGAEQIPQGHFGACLIAIINLQWCNTTK